MFLNKQLIAITILSITPSVSYAFFCPTNFNQIDFGYTMDQVKQLCGNPAKEETMEAKNDNVPQDWSYFVTPPATMSNLPQPVGSLKMSISFDQNDKLINLSVNGVGVGGTTICGGTNVQLGDSKEKVKSACGKPASINKQEPPAPAPGSPEAEANKITEYTYMSNPPAVLVFQKGVLTDRK